MILYVVGASLVAQRVKNLPAVWETWVWSLGWEDPLEEGMATHSSILAWRIPWTEEPAGLKSMRSQRVRHDWATRHNTASDASSKESACQILYTGDAEDMGLIPGSGRSPGIGTGNSLQYSCLEYYTDGKAWWATVYGDTKGQTWPSDWTHVVQGSKESSIILLHSYLKLWNNYTLLNGSPTIRKHPSSHASSIICF